MAILRKFRGPVLLLVLCGVVFWAYQQGYLKPVIGTLKGLVGGKETRKPMAKDFKFEPVSRKDVHQKVLSTGIVTLKTGAEVKIGARISGRLEDLRVKIGDFVRAGDVIAVIEHKDLLARVARFKADFGAEEARLAKIRTEGPLEINKARAELEELQVQVRLAQNMLVRNTGLNKKGVVSTTVVEESEEKINVLNAKIRVAEEELKLKQMQLETNARLAEANLAKAKANLQEEEIQLSYAIITATIDGIVAFVSTQEGETVVASLSAPTFVTLIDLKKLEVAAFVDETDIGRVKVDQKAVFTVDSYPDTFFEGIIREIHPKAVIKDNVVNYEVMMEIDAKNIPLLRPEMTANVVITTGTHENVLAIPKAAVKRSDKGTFVMLKAGGGVQESPVETGWRDGDFIEVLSGLDETAEVGVPIKPEPPEEGKRGPRRS